VLGNVLVTKPVFPEAMEFLKSQVSIDANLDDRILSKQELISRLQGKQGAVTLLTDIVDREVLESIPDVRIICNIAVGFNNVDIENASRLGILVTNTPGVLTETTADFAWTLLMAAARRIVEGDAFARSGQWNAWGLQMLLGNDVFAKTIGIVGFGRIGQAVARRAMGFGMKIQYYDSLPVPPEAVPPGVRAVSLDHLLSTSDFISVHVPLLPETTHLLNDKTFAMMKRLLLLAGATTSIALVARPHDGESRLAAHAAATVWDSVYSDSQAVRGDSLYKALTCVKCHGEINKMEEVQHAKPLSMTFCLECHRHPELNLRPLDKITQLDWTWDPDPQLAAQEQLKHGKEFVRDWNVNASQNCSACHR